MQTSLSVHKLSCCEIEQVARDYQSDVTNKMIRGSGKAFMARRDAANMSL